MNTDPIADFLTRLRNANRAGHKTVIIPMSKMKKEITQILFDQGFILNYKFDDVGVQGSIKIALKYDKLSKEYAKCTSDKLKKGTSEKAKDIKSKTAKKIEEGKKKLKNFNLKDKLKKFKNSKSHKEFTEK